ncbi:MAG TPA: hypothetical protein VLC08_04160 [Chitinolyticbacter sp.]|nr:hypothetical protein [Chitinolyticbacter sp.]
MSAKASSRTADWSLWRALEDWRAKRHELEPLFATAGVPGELESLVNRVLVDLRRSPPTAPLVSGDTQRDIEERARYHEGFYRHYDDSFYKVETMLALPWVPEMQALAGAIREELAALREAFQTQPGRKPDFARLEGLLQHYVKLDHPELPLPEGLLEGRRRGLTEIAGYPLLVQHALKDPYSDAVPPLTSNAFRDEFAARARAYLDTTWLHNTVVTQWYVALALDAGLARKKRDATDHARLARLLKRRWPTLSILIPGFEQADQVWYLLLSGLTFLALFAEWWIAAGVLITWLSLSIGAHRAEKKQIDAHRASLVAQAATMKRVRDRFVAGLIPPGKLAFQLRQLDEAGEYYDEAVYALLGQHNYDEGE